MFYQCIKAVCLVLEAEVKNVSEEFASDTKAKAAANMAGSHAAFAHVFIWLNGSIVIDVVFCVGTEIVNVIM